MEKNSTFVEPYKPSCIHKFYSWIDRLPGPYWLYYIGVIVILGLLNHIVAWNENLVTLGDINWYYAFTSLFLAIGLFYVDFLVRVAHDSLVIFLPILDISEGDRDRILFEFTHLPARSTALVFFLVSGSFLGVALSIFPTAIEMNNAFPELEIPVFILSNAMCGIALYMTFRLYLLTNRLYKYLRTINIYDQHYLYAMSKLPAWMLFLFISTIYLFISLNPSYMSTTQIILYLLVTGIVLSFLIFWFPLRRANHLLVLEKRRLLKDVNRRIETTFGLFHARIDQQEFEHIAEIREAIQSLILEKEFASSLRTWPWQPGTFRGLLTLLLAPLILDLFVMILSKFITF